MGLRGGRGAHCDTHGGEAGSCFPEVWSLDSRMVVGLECSFKNRPNVETWSCKVVNQDVNLMVPYNEVRIVKIEGESRALARW